MRDYTDEWTWDSHDHTFNFWELSGLELVEQCGFSGPLSGSVSLFSFPHGTTFGKWAHNLAVHSVLILKLNHCQCWMRLIFGGEEESVINLLYILWFLWLSFFSYMKLWGNLFNFVLKLFCNLKIVSSKNSLSI